MKKIAFMLIVMIMLLFMATLSYSAKHYSLDTDGCVCIYDDNNWKIKKIATTCNSKNEEMRIVDNKIFVKTRNVVIVYNKQGILIISYPTPHFDDWVNLDLVH